MIVLVIIIIIFALIVAALAFVLLLVATSCVWLGQQIVCKQSPPYALYNLQEGRELSKLYSLRPGTKSVWTDVTYAERGTWKVHSIYYFSESQEKPYLIVLHGTASYSLAWDSVCEQLSKSFNVIAIDLPGFGQSPISTSVDLLVDILKGWHTAVGIKSKISVLGHSFGGFLSTHFAYKYPDIVDRVILADVVGILPSLDVYGAYWALFFKLSPIQRTLRFLGPIGVWIAYTWLLQCKASPASYFEFQVLAEPSADGDLLVASNITVTRSEAFWHNTALDELLKIKCRMALIYGEFDSITPLHQGKVLAELLGPSIPCIALANTGHNITDAPDAATAIQLAYDKASFLSYKDRVIPKSTLRTFTSCWSLSDTANSIERLYEWLRAA